MTSPVGLRSPPAGQLSSPRGIFRRPVVTELQEAVAPQQPDWEDVADARRMRDLLVSCPPLVTAEDAAQLRSLLAGVATGAALVIQAGDCAEVPAEHTLDGVRRKVAGLAQLAAILRTATGKPVLLVGRIGGQFAKPRSKPFESVGDLVLPVFRGHAVNSPEPDLESRRPDPQRILIGYLAARDIVRDLDLCTPTLSGRPPFDRVWTSHEALLLDYEIPMIREIGDGTRWLGSAHWPWIGDRTRRPDGAHVQLLSEVRNPVGCKVGPSMDPAEVTALCERLDPLREPGRLTLISRMGADIVTRMLPPLVRAVRAAGHPVIWLCDPMHGNTITAPDGRKTRLVTTMLREVQGFRRAVAAGGGVAGGLHLEITPDDVTECVADAAELGLVGERRPPLCDPRLNSQQAVSLVSAWTDPR